MGLGLSQLVPLIIYMAVVSACLLSIFWKPQLGIYVLIPLLPFQTLRAKLEGFPLGANIIYLLLISVILGLLFKSQLPIPRTPLNRVLLVLAIFLYISLWQGAFFLSSALPLLPTEPRFSIWKDYMAFPLLFVAALGAIRTPQQMKIAFSIVCLSILLVDRSALMNILGHTFDHFDEGKRDGGPLGYAGSNGLAAFEAQCSCLLLGFATYEKRRLYKLAIYGLVAVTLYCLVYAFSRGGYLSFLVGLLVLGLLKNRKMVLVVVVLLLSWQTIVPLAVQERITMTYNKDDQLEESAEERVQLWTDASELIKGHPVFGTGYATYMFMGRVGNLKDTHNIYIKVLVETGIVGMVLFLWLLAKLFVIAFRLFRSSQDAFNSGLALGLLSLLSCAVAANLFGDRWTYLEVNGVVWVLFALAARASLLQASPRPLPTVATGEARQLASLETELATAGSPQLHSWGN